ncbi:hypothetical protein A3H10_04075 [Candidatus Uhrbacteria bacterium RIFCSPLOWO2_12_FULL_46_10]|uniref:Glycosyl transferase family 1 domain-containing protein n=1 Tax=Candidatus Uhrbacteria bacterium RIFCSPLOWO2_01_FULL_47_25 TaxID=1802402 RepID=A0A1F7UY21_9BACT|nr:MAG: hypothetical protein A2752_01690 [Candidatus Uhrbacteria bacterium RIFCSPHIGHO2_01_FULL_46_23]OGL70656.1 MAG: hypothetical protein A3D60_04315 [Candidatus Uhrbacteria bacterium RIFCSPHIGHO2_02_FULL_47_29]OGL76422.1 MAG: hypothetical protein A3E96_02335 [Candidatus Uhrbacteria bacterium RIFCSPHIGHO2_12_FULL_46_13]OGL83163.1 MAG: hypothetical protein A2936_01535 [Candidatus Uhrbacteria bacterium RIFCSPLOWO2_01_FULL_47_25]OGL84071.1 MAG: hypothetical protein A3I37_01840 [Candidatus Uhrbact
MDKILFVTLEFPPDIGGVGRMYREICRALPAESVVVLTPPNTKSVQYKESPLDNYSVIRSSLLVRWWWPRWVIAIFRINYCLKHYNISRTIVGQVLPLGTAVWILSFIKKTRYAVFVHGMDVSLPIRHSRKRWLLKNILGRAEKVLAANNFVAQMVRNLGLPAEQVVVIYPSPVIKKLSNNTLTENLRQRYNLQNKPILLTIGRLVERKGHEIILMALESVWREAPQLRYFIIGTGPFKNKLEDLRALLSHPHQVIFLGEINDEETAAWLSLATIFIMTPRALANGDAEGFGLVYLEAAFFGKPVIASRTGGVSEAVIDGQTGIIVEENNVEATAMAILKLLKNPSLAEELGRDGQERVEKQFSAESAAQRIKDVFGY